MYCSALVSGTAAICLSLINLGVNHGDDVICQSFTFSAIDNPIVYQDAITTFLDGKT
ncbi:DegT/DnrJ/EryC1/StrS family aminotransferase [Tenuifilum thalassicum]|uniref:DegT/DnrJ/EryC1/StrS family aminotransferase n=1 Tax=Tenuifilum thalassicum TaxID=2590900 RepID=UPI001FE6DF33|nr:DegT/DnrJ/EryC1/StrS family aminotransferase [Tenuifilum thalassicum]